MLLCSSASLGDVHRGRGTIMAILGILTTKSHRTHIGPSSKYPSIRPSKCGLDTWFSISDNPVRQPISTAPLLIFCTSVESILGPSQQLDLLSCNRDTCSITSCMFLEHDATLSPLVASLLADKSSSLCIKSVQFRFSSASWFQPTKAPGRLQFLSQRARSPVAFLSEKTTTPAGIKMGPKSEPIILQKVIITCQTVSEADTHLIHDYSQPLHRIEKQQGPELEEHLH